MIAWELRVLVSSLACSFVFRSFSDECPLVEERWPPYLLVGIAVAAVVLDVI